MSTIPITRYPLENVLSIRVGMTEAQAQGQPAATGGRTSFVWIF